ncbi:MAG: DUF3098 domain-containing protein [Bacteroidetes bacterium]|jgi:hypothetical protein|nr:DUF3098 domain-containing protein [Bacteroidota bacterium]
MNKKLDKKPLGESLRIPFSKRNYQLLGLSFLLIVIGFVLMYVGDEGRGKPEVIYSFRHTTLPVMFIMLGFVCTAIGIMKRFNAPQ